MTTLEAPHFEENVPVNKVESKTDTGVKFFDVERPHQSPKFYEVHKHIENLLATIFKKTPQKEVMMSLKNKIEKSLLLEGVEADKQYGELAAIQSEESNIFVEKLNLDSKVPDGGSLSSKEEIDAHIENSDKLKQLKLKVFEFYEKAEESTKENFESIRKTVERVMVETNAFIIYTFTASGESSEEGGSKGSQVDSIKNKLDILLSFEPSISTSSVIPGSKQELRKGKYGVVLGGGDIDSVKENGDANVSNASNDEVACDSLGIYKKIADRNYRQYNEILVTNPQLFGFVLNVNVDDNGGLYDFKTSVAEDAVRFKSDFMATMDFAKSRGLPQLVMTPDRRMFSFLDITDEGVVTVGEEITPEMIAKSRMSLVK
ncbi:hypothetical protein K9M47_03800 [Candidatus Gracilibacteria bacterium]|nr:hypothetical protein [Candidatus Gracilibacteria bacterium]MCF7898451.1 hypothetical protein [Candidatus Paceibacterota bacterium]